MSALACAGGLFLGSCRALDFNTYTEAQDVQLGTEAYAEITKTAKVVRSGTDAQTVQRVMQRLVAVADKPDYPWEVVLLDSPETVNAFCLPGGKMAVYTGILPLCSSETGLAVVMGHEIAHALERHGTERLTREELNSTVIQALFGETTSAVVAQLASQFVIGLPWGRDDELEADEIGLMLMARAGYDPRESVAFWGRMAQNSGGGGGPEFLSTHPSDQKRIENLQRLLPEALSLYKP